MTLPTSSKPVGKVFYAHYDPVQSYWPWTSHKAQSYMYAFVDPADWELWKEGKSYNKSDWMHIIKPTNDEATERAGKLAEEVLIAEKDE